MTNEVELTKKLVNSIEAVKAPSPNQNEQSVQGISAISNSKSLYNSTLHIYNQLKHSHLQFSSIQFTPPVHILKNFLIKFLIRKMAWCLFN